MRPGLIFSGLLHLAVILVVIFGLPRLLSRPDPQPQAMVVQLLTIASETRATQANPTPRATAPTEVTQPSPEPPKPEAKPVPPAPAPPPSAAAPPPSAPPEPTPEPPAPPQPTPPPAPPPPPPPKPPEPKPAPPPPPPPAPSPLPPPPPPPKPPEPKPEPPKPEPPKPEVKPEPKPEPPKPVADVPRPRAKPEPPKQVAKLPDQAKSAKDDQSFDSMLRNLTRSTADKNDQRPDPRQKPAVSSAQQSSMPNAPIGAKLTTSEADIIKQQLEACWNIPAGAKDASDLRPEIRLTLDANGDTVRADILDTSRMSDGYWRAAAESARRAALNPQCKHLQIPPEKLRASGNTLTVTFDPRDVL